MYSMHDNGLPEREPSRRELKAIEAEWPQIAADLAELDQETRALVIGDRLDEVHVRRVRRLTRRRLHTTSGVDREAGFTVPVLPVAIAVGLLTVAGLLAIGPDGYPWLVTLAVMTVVFTAVSTTVARGLTDRDGDR